jgi:hypothetical protein
LAEHFVGLPLRTLKQAVRALHDGGRGDMLNLAELFRAAKERFNVELAEWLVCDRSLPVAAEDCAGWGRHHLGYHAAAGGHVELLQHLSNAGLYAPGLADMRAGVVLASPMLGSMRCVVDVVCWLHSRGIPTHGPAADSERDFQRKPSHPPIDAPEYITFHAARSGALGLLQVLVDECGAPLAESACAAACGAWPDGGASLGLEQALPVWR